MFSKQRIASLLKHCKDLFKKKLPSEQHELYWWDYDKIMCYRSNIAQFSRLLFNIYQFSSGVQASEKTYRMIENHSPIMNIQNCEEVLPYAKWALVIVNLGRAILILISLKRLSICKVYFYYNMLNQVILICLPQGVEMHTNMWLFTSNVLFNFCTHYFHFTASLITALATQICFFIGRYSFYDDPLDGKMVANNLFICCWQSLNFLALHLLITKIGFIYSEL